MANPIPPWEQEQAAQALAELHQDSVLDAKEREALKLAESQQLLDQVDRMIAERKGEIERMQRFSSPLRSGIDARGVVLASLGKPGCLLIMIALITLLVIGLMFAGTWVEQHISQIPMPQQTESTAASSLDLSPTENAPVEGVSSEEAPQDDSTSDQSQSGVFP